MGAVVGPLALVPALLLQALGVASTVLHLPLLHVDWRVPRLHLELRCCHGSEQSQDREEQADSGGEALVVADLFHLSVAASVPGRFWARRLPPSLALRGRVEAYARSLATLTAVPWLRAQLCVWARGTPRRRGSFFPGQALGLALGSHSQLNLSPAVLEVGGAWAEL